jgi:hypothetical protein
MAVAATNRVKVSVVREATPGTTPATPAFMPIGPTRINLTGAPKTVVSNELVSDRQVPDLILVGQDIAGDIGFELSVPNLTLTGMDTLLEAALLGAWNRTSERSNTPTAGQITAVAATTYTTTAVSPSWQQDDVILAMGFTNSGNNRVVVAGAATSSTSIVMSGGTVEAAPPLTARLKKIGFQARSAADVQATTAGGNALTATTLSFLVHNLAIGQWVKLGTALTSDATSFGTAANNGWCRISAIAAGRLSFDVVPTGFATDVAAGKTIRVYVGDYLRNGTTQYAHTLEQQELDVLQYQYFTGMQVNQMALTLNPQAILEGTFSFLGMGMNGPTGSRFAGATDVTDYATDVVNTSSNIGRVAENGINFTTASANLVLKAALQINNNLRAQVGIGQIAAYGIGAGRCNITGSLSTYFGDATVLAKILAGTPSSFDFVAKDNAGNSFLVDLPKIKFSSGTNPAPAVDQDIVVDANFQAIKHPTLGYTIHMQRFEAVNV